MPQLEFHSEVISTVEACQHVNCTVATAPMETTQAAASSFYQFVIRSTIGDNYPPKYTHYLPLFIVDGNGNPKPVIARLDDSTFVVKN